MKKILVFILLLIMSISFSSCKKETINDFGEVDKHFSGFYIELDYDKDYKIGWYNPTVTFSFKNEVMRNDSGNVSNIGIVTFGDSSKTYSEDGGVKTAIIMTSIVLPENAKDEVKIYIIRETLGGTLSVDLDRYETINVSTKGTYSINYSYSINGVKYRFQASLGYMKK